MERDKLKGTDLCTVIRHFTMSEFQYSYGCIFCETLGKHFQVSIFNFVSDNFNFCKNLFLQSALKRTDTFEKNALLFLFLVAVVAVTAGSGHFCDMNLLL